MTGRGFVIILLGIIIGLAGGFLIAQIQAPDNTEVLDRIGAVESSVAALQDDIANMGDRLETAVASSAPQLRNVNEAAISSSYYLVGLEELELWLAEQMETADASSVPSPPDGDESGDVVQLTEEEISQLLMSLSEGVTDIESLEAAFDGDEAQAQQLLNLVNQHLTEIIGETGDAEVFTCLSLEADVYTGTNLYVYLQVPRSASEVLPTVWNTLSVPVEDNIFWTTRCLQDDADKR